MNLSSIIMALEAIAWRHEHNLQTVDTTVTELQEQAELLFRLAGRMKLGKDGNHGR